MKVAAEGAAPMAELVQQRVCAEVEGEFVVFLIGMRINRLWKVWRWLPVLAAMPAMLKELGAQPDLGLLGARSYLGGRVLMVVQHWRSVAQLQAYAHARDREHLPAWKRFNDRIGTGGDVGIWHETYVVPPGHAESVYVNMPPFGLGLAGALHPATGHRASAAKRIARRSPAASEPSNA